MGHLWNRENIACSLHPQMLLGSRSPGESTDCFAALGYDTVEIRSKFALFHEYLGAKQHS